MKFLEELEEFVDKGEVSTSPGLFRSIQKADHLVGVCSRRVKLIASFRDTLKEKLSDYDTCLEHKSEGESSERRAKWAGEAQILRQKIKLLGALVWIAIHEDMPELLTKPYVAIRQEWMVVYLDEPEPEMEGVSSISIKAICVMSPGPAKPTFGEN